MGSGLTTVLLDTHVLQWWSAEPKRLSRAATKAIEEADELAIGAISWFELAWMATHARIEVNARMGAWLSSLDALVRTAGITVAIAETAVSLPDSFPGDPADRLIFATSIEHGWPLVTKDDRMRGFRYPGKVTIW